MSETVLMEEMTWREIKEAIQQGKDTAILVSGSIEQHGPHLPTATDTIIGYATAEAVAKKLGNALVAPLIRPALSRHHIDFPGTIALRLETFVKVLEEYCFCLRTHGFKKIRPFRVSWRKLGRLEGFCAEHRQESRPGPPTPGRSDDREAYQGISGFLENKRDHDPAGRRPCSLQRDFGDARTSTRSGRHG